MNLMTLRLLPYIYFALEVFLILPAALYLGGKIMKLQHEKFTFGSCIWMNFIAGLLAGFVTKFNPWVALAVFVVLLGIMIKKQFQASNGTIAVMLAINAVVVVGLSYLQTTVVLRIIGIM